MYMFEEAAKILPQQPRMPQPFMINNVPVDYDDSPSSLSFKTSSPPHQCPIR
jgi:hypothetical protein